MLCIYMFTAEETPQESVRVSGPWLTSCGGLSYVLPWKNQG